MSTLVTETIWLNDMEVCSIEHLSQLSGLSIEDIADLVEAGAIAPVDDRTDPPAFHLHYVVTARTARRLRDDFELDRRGMALALVLLERIEGLERQLASHSPGEEKSG